MSPFVRQPRREPIRSLGPDSQDLNSTQFSLRLTRFHTINGLSLANLDSSDSGSDLRLAWKPEQHAQRPMRILYDHQVFSLQDAGGASRYHFELVRHLQGLDGVELDVLLGLNASVMPFASLRQAGTSVLARATRIKPGLARYAINELLSSLAGPLQGKVDVYHPGPPLGAAAAGCGHPPRLHPRALSSVVSRCRFHHRSQAEAFRSR
jgi:hypothetical protein